MYARIEDLDPATREKIDRVIEAHAYDATQIVGILLDVQDLFKLHYVPETAAYYVAEKLPIKISLIYDCLTFYASLSPTPRAKYPIQVCDSVVCRINHNETLLDSLQDLLGIDVGEVTYDGRFTLEKTPCFGACDIAPAVRVNGEVYGHLDSREKIAALLQKLQ